jgi:hypothetical protein
VANRNMNLDVIVRLKDLLSGPLRGVKAALDGVANMARKIGIVGAAVAGISFLAPIQEAAAFQQQLLDIAGTSNLVGNAAFAYVSKSKEQFETLALQVGQLSDTVAKGAGQMIAAGVDPKLVDASVGRIGRAATAANAEFADMAGVATSLLTTLRLPADQLDGALGGLVVAGKEGAFELKDMAKYFPTLTSQMAKFGITGREAVNFLGAGLQIARKGTADPAEAANNLKNFLSKVLAPATIKNFKDMGVDIEGVMKDAATKGINPIEAVVQKITKLTGISSNEVDKMMKKAKAAGMTDAEALKTVREQIEKTAGAGKLGQLFGDMQVMDFLLPMLGNIDEYQRIKGEVAKATGSVIDADFETQMAGLNRQLITFREIGAQGAREVGFAFGEWLPVINQHLMDAMKWLRELDAETGGMVRKTLMFAGAALMLVTALGALGVVLPVVGAGLGLLASPFTMAGRLAFGVGRYFVTAARSAVALQTALAGMQGVQFTGLARLAVGLRGIAMAVPGVSTLTSVLSAIGAAIAGISAPIWAVIAAVIAVGIAVYKYWEPISNFVSGFAAVVGSAVGSLIGALQGLQAKLLAFAGEKLIDLAKWLGMDDEQIASVVNGVVNLASRMVETIKAIPGMVGNFLSDLFTMNDYSDEAEREFRSAGERAGQAMVDAIKAAFEALFAFFKGLGKMILDAIGKIDLSNIISMPSLPTWLGGSGPKPPTAANQNALPATALPASGSPAAPQQLNVNTTATVKVDGPGQVSSQATSVTSPSPNVNTGRVVGRD